MSNLKEINSDGCAVLGAILGVSLVAGYFAATYADKYGKEAASTIYDREWQ